MRAGTCSRDKQSCEVKKLSKVCEEGIMVFKDDKRYRSGKLAMCKERLYSCRSAEINRWCMDNMR